MVSSEKSILQGWKEIASYVARDVRTVRRWEKDRGLPVHRLPGGGRAVVYAVSAELDRWMGHEPQENSSSAPSLSDTREHQPVLRPSAVPPVIIQPGTAPAASRRLFAPRTAVLFASAVLLTIFVLTVTLKQKSVTRDRRVTAPAERGPTKYISKVPGVDDLYLRALYFSEQRTPDSLTKAQQNLREYSTMPSEQAYPLAQAAAQRAVALDPRLAEAHASLAFTEFFWSWDSQVAEHEFQQAIALEPQQALAHHWYGSMLTHQGRYSEGLEQLELAQRLQPESTAILSSRAFAMGLNGDRPQAVRLLREISGSERLAALSLLAPRDIPQYLAADRLSCQMRHDDAGLASNEDAAQTFRANGESAMWNRLLVRELSLHPNRATYRTAELEAMLGRREEALRDLNALYSSHDWGLIGLTIDPFFVAVRSDPRFLHLQKAVGISGH